MPRSLTFCSVLVVMMVVMMTALGACRGKRGPAGPSGERVPSNVYVATNIFPDDAGPNGPFSRALVVIDIDILQHYVFPYTTMAGGPVMGQAMHTAISPNKRKVYVTMGGDATMPLRLVTIDLNWSGGMPTPTVVNTLELLPAGAQGANPVQGHGLTISRDGLVLFMSELLSNPSARLRVVDGHAGTFVTPNGGAFGDPGDQSLEMPHGFYANPSLTLGMSTQYTFDGDDVTVWTVDGDSASADFGRLTHAATVTLDTGGSSPRGAYTHTAAWRNDSEFYTCCTQETTQGSLAGAEAGVWHVDVSNLSAPVATQVIGEGAGGALEGVSDVVIANGSLFLAEGNLEKPDPPGHISMWDVSGRLGGTPTAPVFVKRLSAGTGLPVDFRETHGFAKTANDEFVIAESYRSNYVVLLSGITGNVIKIWSAADGLSMPHGGYAQ